MKNLLLLILISIVHGSPILKTSRTLQDKEASLISIKKEIYEIDKYKYQHQKEIITLISVEGKKGLIKMRTEDWPDNTEYIYCILKGPSGKVILTVQVPYSQSGDWYEEFKHYYNNDGKTIAFSKRVTVFDESVTGGVAVFSTLHYYGSNFNLISQTNKLTDVKGKSLKRKVNEFDFRDDKYTIYKNVKDCLAGYHIKLNN